MINSNKIYFITSPLGQHATWCLENLENLLCLDKNNKIYFKFGSPARLDYSSGVSPYNRISVIINDQISNFHNTNFFYYGWELVPCLQELYNNFPGSEFFLVVNNLNDTKLESLNNGKMGKYNDTDFLYRTARLHRTIIDEFINDKKCTTTVKEKKNDGVIEKSITTYHLTN